MPALTTDSLQHRERLQNRRAELTQQVARLAAEKDKWSAQDRAEWDAANSEIDRIGEQLPRFGRDGASVLDGPVNHAMFGGAPHALDAALNSWGLAQMGQPVTPSMAAAAEQYGVAPNSPTFVVNIGVRGPMTGRQAFRNALSSHGETSGAYTVSQGFVARLERALLDFNSVLNVAEVMRTNDGRELPWPTNDDTGNEGAQIGESAESTELDPTFGQAIFRAYKYTSRLVRVPHELLRDCGLDFAGELGAMLGERLGRATARAFTVGSGAAGPQGIVTGSTLGVTAASASAITLDEVNDLIASVDNAYLQPGCGFMAHQLVWNKIRKLKDGSGQYLWQPSNQAGQAPTLLGWPCYVNNFMSSTFASGNKTLLFGLLSKYKIRMVADIRIKRLVERFAEFDQQGFLGFSEADGILIQPAAIKHLVH